MENPSASATTDTSGLWESGVGSVVLRNVGPGEPCGWLHFHSPQTIVRADRISDVRPALAEVVAAAERGAYAAGFLSYEAAPAFDSAFTTRPPGDLPLLWFGLFEEPAHVALPEPDEVGLPPLDWQPGTSISEYQDAITRVREYIASGDTYQVNYTLRLRAPFNGDAWALFRRLAASQRAGYLAYVDTGEHALCSASPELFFSLAGEEVVCRPMKGTAPRGMTTSEDRELAAWLAASEKNRAENVMIVDMVRNDLGRIARPGSVSVPDLFTVEKYDTLFQMTSTVTAQSAAPFDDIVAALFPCASITGAPKVRTMQIIAELEREPRGIYTGCIGYLAPGRIARFNVAIRTVHVDRARRIAEYGVGGGIVWDSTASDEYEECRTKAKVLFAPRPSFCLLETLLWQPEGGYSLLERHLARVADSADYFQRAADVEAIRRQLAAAARGFPPQTQRVRLLVAEDGSIEIEARPFEVPSPHPAWRVALARQPVDRADRFLYHKTTHRAVYEAARAECSGFDDVILWNDRGEVTESTIANVVVEREGERITPPVESGLLAGTLRAELLDAGEIREGVIACEELRSADALYLINSVRGWIPAVLEAA